MKAVVLGVTELFERARGRAPSHMAPTQQLTVTVVRWARALAGDTMYSLTIELNLTGVFVILIDIVPSSSSATTLQSSRLLRVVSTISTVDLGIL
jgi:hypothetical protein